MCFTMRAVVIARSLNNRGLPLRSVIASSSTQNVSEPQLTRGDIVLAPVSSFVARLRHEIKASE